MYWGSAATYCHAFWSPLNDEHFLCIRLNFHVFLHNILLDLRIYSTSPVYGTLRIPAALVGLPSLVTIAKGCASLVLWIAKAYLNGLDVSLV